MSAKDVIELSKTGYAGVDKQGRIVDRREFPDAVPMPANTMFGVPEPIIIERMNRVPTEDLEDAYAKLQAEKRTQNIVNEPIIVDDKNKWISFPVETGWHWFNPIGHSLRRFTDELIPYCVIDDAGTMRAYVGGNLVNCKTNAGRWMKMQHVPEV